MTLKKLVNATEDNTGNVVARLQMSKSINVIFYIFDFCQDLTCAHDCHRQTELHDTQTHRQTELHDMPMAIGKPTDLPKNYYLSINFCTF